MGRNGVGKTTLLKVIMGLLPAASGKIRFGDADLPAGAPDARARAGIGYVPQGREIFPSLTVEENLMVGRLALGASATCPRRVLALFPVLKTMLRRRGGDLSGGQQQQLAMGRALALDPKLLILDEPTEGIQPNIVAEIGDVIARLGEDGVTVLFVEQKLAFARRVGAQLRDPRPRPRGRVRRDRRADRRPGPEAPDRVHEGEHDMANITIDAEPGAIVDRSEAHGGRHDRHAARLPRAGRVRRDARQRRLAAREGDRPGGGAARRRAQARGCWSSTRARATAPTWPTRRRPRSSAARPAMRIGDPGPMGRILIRGEARPRHHPGALRPSPASR